VLHALGHPDIFIQKALCAYLNSEKMIVVWWKGWPAGWGR